MESEKRRLRALYKRSAVAWNAYKSTKDLGEKVRLAEEAKEISAAIESIRASLGYDEVDGYVRKQNLCNVVKDREGQAAFQRRTAQSAAYANRADAYEVMKATKTQRDYLKGWWEYDEIRGEYVHFPGALKKGDPRIDEAEKELKAAREEYRRAKKEAAACKKATTLLVSYKKFALDLAGDASVPDADVERAKEKYLKALRQLETPTPDKVQELTTHLKDLQKSQALRDEKRDAARNEEKKTRANDYGER